MDRKIDGLENLKNALKYENIGKIYRIKGELADTSYCYLKALRYFMEYEKNEYRWIVYVDDIEKWQECKVLDVDNKRLGINRATVVTTTGTQLNRRVKFIIGPEDEDFKQDRCIYFFDDLDDEDKEYWNELINKESHK